jgi:ESS family glutamate:Na+ symporter
MLGTQVIIMVLFAYFVCFRVMGRDYDAAVLSAGFCGFGMGATPNAMANMQAITEKYHPSIKAYIIIPIIGSMFCDLINSLVITMFISFV